MVSATSFDALAFAFAVFGSFSMGSYPVPIKAPAVLQANVHPLIFQCYKSFWVFVVGLVFILVNLLRHKPAYTFTYWGFLGAAAWVPAGVGTIAAVPRLGVGMAIVMVTGTSACLQFVVGQLVGEKMKHHGSSHFVLAPWYLLAVVIGMSGLVLSPSLRLCKATPQDKDLEQPESNSVQPEDNAEVPLHPGASEEGGCSSPGPSRVRQMLEGMACALMAGIFSALQFAVIAIGKKVESSRSGDVNCENDYDLCPDWFKNEFDAFGSYMVTFGIGAGSMTTLIVGAFASKEKLAHRPVPQSHFGVLKFLGSIAGCCWVVGNIFQSAAVNKGGASVMGPTNQAVQLITSGAWGILYYKEVKEPVRVLCWVLSAAWTVAFVILLGQEKE